MERFLDYWQAAHTQQLLHALQPQQVLSICQQIAAQACVQGKLPAANLALVNSSVVIIPFYAQKEDKIFFPCMLQVDVNATGDFEPQAHLSLPIISHAMLEPAPLCPISLGVAEDFANYLAINPAPWLVDNQRVTWDQQLAYADELLNAVVPNWRSDLTQAGYMHANDALVFPLAAITQASNFLPTVNFDLLNNPNKITLIDAERNADQNKAGQSKYAWQLIVNAWIQAALKQAEPPRYVWLQPQQTVTYANIFACMGATTTVHTMDDMHSQLIIANEAYLQGQQLLRNWQEVSKRIYEKYADKGGVQARIDHLQSCAREAKAQSRHLEVLNSIWLRQKELLVEWVKVFDFIPTMQTQRLQRLHTFFKQNFPGEVVKGFTETQFDDLLIEKIRRAENNLRMVGDALHQVENDLYQEQLVRDKCLQWCSEQNVTVATVTEVEKFLEEHIWQQLARLALLYWQQDFAAKQGYGDFLNRQPHDIEYLIVENAEYIDPIQAIQYLSMSKKAVVMGNYNPIINPRFPVQIDYELTKHFDLIENDADFEDLQFDGVLVSTGNMWNMVAKDRDADQIFTRPESTLEYEFVDVRSSSCKYLGSMVNQGVIDPVHAWLNKHATERNQVVIYTCFAGQVKLLQQVLSTTLFAQVPICLIQEPCFTKSAFSIFVPVYSAQDPKPYVFDRGIEMFDQLIANTTQKIIVIGDVRIFKAELHSATGKFAQQIFAFDSITVT